MPHEYKKSHNSYWCKPQVLTEVKHGCNVFEIDLVYVADNAVAMHSKKPFAFLGFGSLHQYIDKMIEHVNYDSVLQIEIKDDNIELAGEVIRTILGVHYRLRHPLTYAIHADPSRPGRVKVAEKILRKLCGQSNVTTWEEWSKDKHVLTVDLYGTIKWWWK